MCDFFVLYSETSVSWVVYTPRLLMHLSSKFKFKVQVVSLVSSYIYT